MAVPDIPNPKAALAVRVRRLHPASLTWPWRAVNGRRAEDLAASGQEFCSATTVVSGRRTPSLVEEPAHRFTSTNYGNDEVAAISGLEAGHPAFERSLTTGRRLRWRQAGPGPAARPCRHIVVSDSIGMNRRKQGRAHTRGWPGVLGPSVVAGLGTTSPTFSNRYHLHLPFHLLAPESDPLRANQTRKRILREWSRPSPETPD